MGITIYKAKQIGVRSIVPWWYNEWHRNMKQLRWHREDETTMASVARINRRSESRRETDSKVQNNRNDRSDSEGTGIIGNRNRYWNEVGVEQEQNWSETWSRIDRYDTDDADEHTIILLTIFGFSQFYFTLKVT